jgi:hypothetical protein
VDTSTAYQMKPFQQPDDCALFIEITFFLLTFLALNCTSYRSFT